MFVFLCFCSFMIRSPQEEKNYVQDIIPKDGELIHDWIVSRNARVYISG